MGHLRKRKREDRRLAGTVWRASKERVERAFELKKQGLTTKVVSERTGVSMWTINKVWSERKREGKGGGK